MKYMASCSCGKDSVAMIEMIIDSKMPLDEIVFAEVEKSFEEELIFMKKIIKRWELKGYKCTVLKTEDTWDNWFYGKSTRGKSEGLKRGYPLTAYACWWSREAKFKILDKYMEGNIRYIGIAMDEPDRYHPEKYDEGYRYPLADVFMKTEAECRKFCDDRGILNPLYKHFSRLGCYICPKQNERTLIKLCKHFPKEWEELKFYINECNNKDFVSPGVFNIQINSKNILELEEKALSELTFNFENGGINE